MNQYQVSIEITEKENCPLSYSVKINGLEVSEHVCGLSYVIKPGELPKLRLELYTQGVKLKSTALMDIPEPYKSLVDYKLYGRME